MIGYWIFGAPNILFAGFLTCFASIIPMVGTALVWFPIALLFGASCMLPASAAKYMTLVFADGSEQSLQLSAEPNVSLTRTMLYVRFNNPQAGQTDLKFNKQNVKKYFFSDEATDVESVADTQTGMNVQGNRIVVRGAKGAVGVFRTDGTQVQTVVKVDGDTVVIELDNLANGTS